MEGTGGRGTQTAKLQMKVCVCGWTLHVMTTSYLSSDTAKARPPEMNGAVDREGARGHDRVPTRSRAREHSSNNNNNELVGWGTGLAEHTHTYTYAHTHTKQQTQKNTHHDSLAMLKGTRSRSLTTLGSPA
jgi:hypothetical protein